VYPNTPPSDARGDFGGVALMFHVNWVVSGSDVSPIEREKSVFNNLDILVTSCSGRLEAMREKHPGSPPAGFVVFDAADKEVFRWFGETVAEAEIPALEQQ
jgi:hypothetical protein